MSGALSVLGIGLELPPAVSVRDHVAAHGVDVSDYRGREHVCHGGADDHPSTMGAHALGVALDDARVSAEDLRLVIYSGASRDYVPSWSVSSEVMHRCGASERCVGLDMTAGCLATVAALDLIQGWLAAHGGGHAAVVAAERWSQTIDYADPGTVNLWAYGDSAGALVVGQDVGQPSRIDFLGAEFRSASQNNGHILIPYGGTREPVAPPGVNPNVRQVSDRPKQQITDSYRKGYRTAFDALRDRFDREPTRLVCNQLSPNLVGMVSTVFGLEDATIVTGHDTGHLGGPDVIVGLGAFLDGAFGDDTVLMSASAAYGFGAAFLVRPPQRGIT